LFKDVASLIIAYLNSDPDGHKKVSPLVQAWTFLAIDAIWTTVKNITSKYFNSSSVEVQLTNSYVTIKDFNIDEDSLVIPVKGMFSFENVPLRIIDGIQTTGTKISYYGTEFAFLENVSANDLALTRDPDIDKKDKLQVVTGQKNRGSTGSFVVNSVSDSSFSSLIVASDSTSNNSLKGDDYLYGSVSHDNINGDAGNDNLYGGADNDNLYGGYGNDLLTGGLGKDALTGGLGTDRFDYRNLADSLLNNFDVITDFNANEDKFVVSNPLSEFFSAFFVTTLDVNSISGILTSTDFQANAAARFQLLSFGFKNITTRTRTFVAINDGIAGFDANTDAIIEVTGLTGTLGLNNFTTTLA
jgi:hypothetical protein